MGEKPLSPPKSSIGRWLASGLGWSRASYVLVSLLAVTILVIVIVWWPLVEEQIAYFDPSRPLWVQVDWLLLGVFAFMSLMIMVGADLKRDALVVAVGLGGGLVIESWGTQTELWTYYTAQRPPLWIIPAWPVASLAIDRLVRMLDRLAPRGTGFRAAYWLLVGGFYVLMIAFVWPTLGKSFSVMAVALSTLLLLTPRDHRMSVLTFVAGSGLGYFLERWGTTRQCWTYYTRQAPPLFAVLAHGFAALAFWRVAQLARLLYSRWEEQQVRSRA